MRLMKVVIGGVVTVSVISSLALGYSIPTKVSVGSDRVGIKGSFLHAPHRYMGSLQHYEGNIYPSLSIQSGDWAVQGGSLFNTSIANNVWSHLLLVDAGLGVRYRKKEFLSRAFASDSFSFVESHYKWASLVVANDSLTDQSYQTIGGTVTLTSDIKKAPYSAFASHLWVTSNDQSLTHTRVGVSILSKKPTATLDFKVFHYQSSSSDFSTPSPDKGLYPFFSHRNALHYQVGGGLGSSFRFQSRHESVSPFLRLHYFSNPSLFFAHIGSRYKMRHRIGLEVGLRYSNVNDDIHALVLCHINSVIKGAL